MTQLVELQEALPKFQAAGIELYAVSYDAPDALADFARHQGITYPLLSDKGSRVIRRLGILNHFVTRDQVPYHGIPFPGTYLLDEEGRVMAKLFNRNLAARDSAEAMIDSALGEILLGEEEPTARADAEDVRITAAFHGGGGKWVGGAMRQLVVRFELAPGLHLYDEPVPEGMVATRIDVEGPEGMNTRAVIKPPTQPLRLPGLDAELRVWEGRVDFTIPTWLDDRIASLVEERPLDPVEVELRVAYQVCDDAVCRIPRKETLRLEVPVAAHLAHDLAGKLGGAEITTMDSRKHMMRMVRLGLLRSPIKGYQFLRQTIRDVRRGPAGRRRS